MSHPTVVTAGLPYANGSIHIGHLVEYIMTDVYVRALKMSGEDAIYICADDTHGTPIEISAQKAGVAPEIFVQRVAEEHTEDFRSFGIHFDSYWSTNSPENRKWVEEIYGKLRDKGYITKRPLEQYFDQEAGRFLPDRFIKGTCPKCKTKDQYGDACEQCGTTYEPTDLEDPVSVLTGSRPVLRTSEHLFVNLAQFTEVLKAWVSTEGRLQPEVRNWVEGWITGGLRDWCISRDPPYFGFEIPDMPGKYFYVWLDAPIGYISSTENWARQKMGRPELVDHAWRAGHGRRVHVIGKDIVYFHALFWPAMLHASALATPDHVQVHGFLTVDGVKMSKSRGTFINAKTFRKHLDPIYLRYYLASKSVPTVDDVDLVLDEFVERINADLVGKLVNLVARAASFLSTKLDGRFGQLPTDASTSEHLAAVRACAEAAQTAYQAFDSAGAVRQAVEIARIGNKIFQDGEPWKLLKAKRGEAQDRGQDANTEATKTMAGGAGALSGEPEAEPEREDAGREKARAIVTLCLNIARASAVALAPALPEFARKVYPILGLEGVPAKFEEAWAFDLVDRPMGHFDRIFDRIERTTVDAIVEDSKDGLRASTSVSASGAKAASTSGSASGAKAASTSGSASGAKAASTSGSASGAKAASTSETSTGNTDGAGIIQIDTFQKVDLRVGLIKKAETVEGADKLLALTVDLGEERPRKIFAGIRSAYEPGAIEGLRVAVVANLAPRKMRFGTSEGMILAAGSGGKDLWLLTVSDKAAPGSKIS